MTFSAFSTFLLLFLFLLCFLAQLLHSGVRYGYDEWLVCLGDLGSKLWEGLAPELQWGLNLFRYGGTVLYGTPKAGLIHFFRLVIRCTQKSSALGKKLYLSYLYDDITACSLFSKGPSHRAMGSKPVLKKGGARRLQYKYRRWKQGTLKE